MLWIRDALGETIDQKSCSLDSIWLANYRKLDILISVNQYLIDWQRKKNILADCFAQNEVFWSNLIVDLNFFFLNRRMAYVKSIDLNWDLFTYSRTSLWLIEIIKRFSSPPSFSSFFSLSYYEPKKKKKKKTKKILSTPKTVRFDLIRNPLLYQRYDCEKRFNNLIVILKLVKSIDLKPMAWWIKRKKSDNLKLFQSESVRSFQPKQKTNSIAIIYVSICILKLRGKKIEDEEDGVIYYSWLKESSKNF